MSTYPGAIPSYSNMDPNQTLSAAGHTSRHNEVQADVSAIATKVGTGASTPINHTVLKGNSVGSSAWGAIDLAADVTNTLPLANMDSLALLNLVYPIGSVYLSVVATDPGTLFGVGNWQAFGQGKTLVGLNAADTDFNAAEKTGGEKTHQLTTAEMPAHTHTYTAAGSTNESSGATANAVFKNPLPGTNTSSTGGDGSHNNLQPYIVTYMWKRIS